MTIAHGGCRPRIPREADSGQRGMLLLLVAPSLAVDSNVFAADLEQCIRDAAARAAAGFPRYGYGCLPATTKVDVQAEILGETITPFEARYGYQAAVWCAFYSTDMTGEEADPNDPQPNNPQFYECAPRANFRSQGSPPRPALSRTPPTHSCDRRPCA